MVLAPEWFLDYVNGGFSMNLRTRLTYGLTPRINIWVTPSAGIFGDFQARYQWSADMGSGISYSGSRVKAIRTRIDISL